MGISGLLPLLKSIQKHCTLKKFAGQTIGIDAYGWLHRGTVACAIELALDKPTTKYVDFAMGRVRMLLDFGITPYLVFDGDALPSKAGTNKERRKKRDESKALGLELYKAGKISQAHQELQKAADVTPYMARQLIEELKRHNVQYVVAPYEADAQLVYLEQKGIIDGILSEDSDLLVFGAKRLLTKLNQYGECVEIERTDFASCREVSLAGWTDAMFRRMAILSGCDYLPNINKMGLKTAYRFVRKYKEAEKILRMIQFEGQFTVPLEYIENFKNAELTFLHHRVFCPIKQKLVFLTELDPGTKEEHLPFLGEDVDPEIAVGVACGDLNARTKEPIAMKKPLTASRPALQDQRRQTFGSSAELKPKKSIDSFFKSRRQPLAELDPNSLTPSPSQQRLLQVHANASWEMRTVSSAPQLRRTATSIISSSSAHRIPSTDRSTFLARASTISTYQPPKRQRLCSDTDGTSPSQDVKQSPFFVGHSTEASPLVQKKSRSKKARKSDFDVWSDDSLDGILLGLPEVQQVASPDRPNSETPENVDGTSNANQVEDGYFDAVIGSSPLLERAKFGRSGGVSKESSNAASSTLYSQERVCRETNATSLGPEDEDGGFFVDLFELHGASQREALLKTFVCQSPSRRAKALASISPCREVESIAPRDSKIPLPTKGSPKNKTKAASVEATKQITFTGLDGTSEPSGDQAETHVANIQTTFAYQTPSSQALALESLNQSQKQKVELGRAALSTSVSTETRRPSMSSLQRLRAQAMRPNKPALGRKTEGALDRAKAVEVGKQAISRATASTKGSEDLIVPDSEDESGEETAKPTLDLKAYVFTTT